MSSGIILEIFVKKYFLLLKSPVTFIIKTCNFLPLRKIIFNCCLAHDTNSEKQQILVCGRRSFSAF